MMLGMKASSGKKQSNKTRMRTGITREKSFRTKIRKTKKTKTRTVTKITTRAIQG